LEGGESGTFSVLREWTDRAPPGGATEGKGGSILAASALLELAALLAVGAGAKKKD
jgi:hypothetical protein